MPTPSKGQLALGCVEMHAKSRAERRADLKAVANEFARRQGYADMDETLLNTFYEAAGL